MLRHAGPALDYAMQIESTNQVSGYVQHMSQPISIFYSSLTPPLPALSACSILFLSALGSP